MAASAASTKATFGWLTRSPAQTEVSKLETRLRWVGFKHRGANPQLKRLVLGQAQDVMFSSGAAALAATARLVKRLNRPLRDWGLTGGPAARLRKWFSRYQWQEFAPWIWTHPPTGGRICLNPHSALWTTDFPLLNHMAREAWRFHWWSRLFQGTRHELPSLGRPSYSSILIEHVKRQAIHADTNQIAVLTGAFVSPQMRNRQGGTSQEACPWCGHTGTFEHVAWACSAVPWVRPPRPASAVVARFGWGDESVLGLLVRVRSEILARRHDGIS